MDQNTSFLTNEIDALQKLLGKQIKHLETDFQDFGYSGHVYKIKITDTTNQTTEYILKKPLDTADYNVYKDIFEPLELQSPHIYGIVHNNGEDFLLTEHIPHKKLYDWTEQNYQQAMDWLIKKDNVIEKNLEQIKQLPYILPVLRDRIDDWTARIIQGVQQSVHPLLTQEFLKQIEGKRDTLRKILQALSRTGRLTLTHNNLITYHILFPTTPMKYNLYVIDWSEPSIGTVCKDLIKFLKSAPDAYKPELIQQYRAHINFENFDEIYQQTEIIIDLSALAWMVEKLTEGKYHIVDMHDFENRVRTIYKFLQSI
jgi:hypothetical protein